MSQLVVDVARRLDAIVRVLLEAARDETAQRIRDVDAEIARGSTQGPYGAYATALAEMIRQDKVHAIVCTGANLEEDIFNLVAHDYYERVPHYRHLTADDEQALLLTLTA